MRLEILVFRRVISSPWEGVSVRIFIRYQKKKNTGNTDLILDRLLGGALIHHGTHVFVHSGLFIFPPSDLHLPLPSDSGVHCLKLSFNLFS